MALGGKPGPRARLRWCAPAAQALDPRLAPIRKPAFRIGSRGRTAWWPLGDGFFDPEPWYPVERDAGKGCAGGKRAKSLSARGPWRIDRCAIAARAVFGHAGRHAGRDREKAPRGRARGESAFQASGCVTVV